MCVNCSLPFLLFLTDHICSLSQAADGWLGPPDDHADGSKYWGRCVRAYDPPVAATR